MSASLATHRLQQSIKPPVTTHCFLRNFYFSNIDIPAGKDYDGAVLKLKRKWYKKNIDESFEVGGET